MLKELLVGTRIQLHVQEACVQLGCGGRFSEIPAAWPQTQQTASWGTSSYVSIKLTYRPPDHHHAAARGVTKECRTVWPLTLVLQQRTHRTLRALLLQCGI
jgi:hypothetical protein